MSSPLSSPVALKNLPTLATVLDAVGAVDRTRLVALQQQAQVGHSTLMAEVVRSKAVTTVELATLLARQYGMPLVDLDVLNSAKFPQGAIDLAVCQAARTLVVAKRGSRLTVATADPSDAVAVGKVETAARVPIDWVVVEYDKLEKVLPSSSKIMATPAAVPTAVPLTTMATTDDFGFEGGNRGGDVEDAPVVKFLQKMLIDAIQMGASDLHFEPYEQLYRVRFRVDGELREISAPPIAIKDQLSSRIKVLSRLDISEKRVPQDGRMKVAVTPERVIDLRVSTLPTLYGEKVVIRILDSDQAKLGIDALGYEPAEKSALLNAIHRPYGMVLVTGPTGSGKTVSLYSCLNLLNKPGVNISTVEDPSEINLPGVNQVNVNDKAGMNFAAALKAFLRQDPDIIMVGEIRDLETADIAIKASQTGHLVLSTLHTNDAPATLSRLRNMGVAPFNIASSVILITAQRLVRRLCPKCKTPVKIPRETLAEAGFKEEDLQGDWTPYGPVGCSACNNGYKGRVGVYQVMPITEALQEIILRDGTELEIAQQSEREGVRSLRQAGLTKVRLGVTSLEEVLGATNI